MAEEDRTNVDEVVRTTTKTTKYDLMTSRAWNMLFKKSKLPFQLLIEGQSIYHHESFPGALYCSFCLLERNPNFKNSQQQIVPSYRVQLSFQAYKCFFQRPENEIPCWEKWAK
jgi:hypothetical protein